MSSFVEIVISNINLVTLVVSLVVEVSIIQIGQKNLMYMNDASKEIIVYRKLPPVLFFLIPFFAIWSGGSMYGIYVKPILENRLELSGTLFGIPFLLGTLVMLFIILFLLFGHFKLCIHNQESYLGCFVFGINQKKIFDSKKISTIMLQDSSYSKNKIRQKEIVIKFKDGEELKFGAMLKDESKNKIAEFLATKKLG